MKDFAWLVLAEVEILGLVGSFGFWFSYQCPRHEQNPSMIFSSWLWAMAKKNSINHRLHRFF